MEFFFPFYTHRRCGKEGDRWLIAIQSVYHASLLKAVGSEYCPSLMRSKEMSQVVAIGQLSSHPALRRALGDNSKGKAN